MSKIASLKKDYGKFTKFFYSGGLFIVLIESRGEAYNYGATAVLARGQSRAAKRVMLFLTVFVFSGFFSEFTTIVICKNHYYNPKIVLCKNTDLCCAVMLLLLMLKIQNNFEMEKWSDAYYFFLFAQVSTIIVIIMICTVSIVSDSAIARIFKCYSLWVDKRRFCFNNVFCTSQ